MRCMWLLEAGALYQTICARQKDRRVHFSAAQPFAEAEAGKR